MTQKENKKTRVLCIDHEGGRGGSSRSLFESLMAIDPDRIEATVWCRRESHLLGAYKDHGIPTKVVPDWPRFTPLKRLMPSVVALAVSTVRFLRFFGQQDKLLKELSRNFDIVHLNHESLFPLAWLIRRYSELPISMHIRTVQFDTALGRWQTRSISRYADHLIFISTNEQRTFRSRGGRADRQAILTNFVNSPRSDGEPPTLPAGDHLIVASIGNLSLEQGTDRLIELAQVLREWGRSDVHFVVAGQMGLSPRMRRQLPQIARSARVLPEYAEALGLSGYFTFLGHVQNPANVLEAAHIGIKLNRLGSNWGRDVLEAIAAGVPMLAIGSDKTFIRPNETGLLFENYWPEQICRALIDLKDDAAALEAMEQGTRALKEELIDPKAHGGALMDQWQTLHRDGRARL